MVIFPFSFQMLQNRCFRKGKLSLFLSLSLLSSLVPLNCIRCPNSAKHSASFTHQRLWFIMIQLLDRFKCPYDNQHFSPRLSPICCSLKVQVGWDLRRSADLMFYGKRSPRLPSTPSNGIVKTSSSGDSTMFLGSLFQ